MLAAFSHAGYGCNYEAARRLACMHARGIAAHTRSLVGSDQVRWRSCISTVKVPDRWIPDCGGS
eukprot:5691647-Pyramimonas_sp.AAC.1